jgi:hypothetical protein
MDTLAIITSLSTFLSLGINFYLYKKIQVHNHFIGVSNNNFRLIVDIMKENNERITKNNQTLIDNTNKIFGIDPKDENHPNNPNYKKTPP